MVMRSIFLCGFEVLCLTLTSDVDSYIITVATMRKE